MIYVFIIQNDLMIYVYNLMTYLCIVGVVISVYFFVFLVNDIVSVDSNISSVPL